MKYVEVNENIATVKVNGSWSVIQTLGVEEDCAAAYSKGANKFIIDLHLTTFMESSAIQSLVRLRRKVGKNNFWVINPHDEVYRLLKGSNLLDWIKE